MYVAGVPSSSTSPDGSEGAISGVSQTGLSSPHLVIIIILAALLGLTTVTVTTVFVIRHQQSSVTR